MRPVIVLLGCPGAGKGTQARLLQERFSLPHISTGDILRDEVARQTDTGRLVMAQMNAGGLVGDDVVNRAVEDRITRPDCAGGFILDGYPRTVEQAEFLKTLLFERDQILVLDFHVECEELLSRLSARRHCPACNAIYNLSSAPPMRPGVCDSCGGELEQRADDREDVIRERFARYREQTLPLVGYYQLAGSYRRVHGAAPPLEVFGALESIIAQYWFPQISHIP